MQFIPNGPDIPDALLQAHEEGRVVFFCGAGISYPAGLPGFRELVEKIYLNTHIQRFDIEQDAFDRGQYDATLDLLEKRLLDPLGMRRALAKALKPNLRRTGATETHSALLRLGHDRAGALRLVTTNFDRVFHAAALRSNQRFQEHAAPLLPVPKRSRWNGLVYLHGLLPEKVDDTELNRLVVTSGDFGLAYLTERWAARFVSELFRNYAVCFVGYSISDPILRYMMDALAADKRRGEVSPVAWAFGDCEPGQEVRKKVEWEAKGVEPILYSVTANAGHSALHSSLQAWADTYRDGVTGKERIVVTHAMAQPGASTQQDDFVGRMLWALSDRDGLPARRFAEFDPVPSLDWLITALSENRYGHADLPRFGVTPRSEVDEDLRFSFIDRPTPYHLAPRMRIVSGGAADRQWDDVMSGLASWLTRHLNDVRLVLWIAERGGELHEVWKYQIERKLDYIARLEREGKQGELAEMVTHAPNAVPGRLMRLLWRLLLGGRVRPHRRAHNIYQWISRWRRDGLTTTLRFELRELLAPQVRFRPTFTRSADREALDEPSDLRQLVDWELVLAADHVRTALADLSEPRWREAVVSLLDDTQQLLRDALDLMCELGASDARGDLLHLHLPSVSPHPQNKLLRDWVALIELVRDGWVALQAADRTTASRIALAWFELPYPTFKRLAFFAASQEEGVRPEIWVSWLLADEAWWLWASCARREVLRLLVLRGSQVPRAELARLVSAILAGPPRDNGQKHNGSDDRWQQWSAGAIWLRLAKLGSAGAKLGRLGSARLAELSKQHPHWRLAENESDEFPYWASGTGDPDFEASRIVDVAPRNRRELVTWLERRRPERQHPFYEDTWRDVCRSRFFHSFAALCDLAADGSWPVDRWSDALHAWSDAGTTTRSWRYGAPLVAKMPQEVFAELSRSVAWWLEAASKSLDRHQPIMLELVRRILALQKEDLRLEGHDGESIQEAINHEVGIVTKALINVWFGRKPNDNDLLPSDIAPLLTQLCDLSFPRFRHGRVLLSAHLIALFRVDRSWTEQNLLPLFDWKVSPCTAKAAWQGFLWSPRLYPPLLLAFKEQFLDTAHHYADLEPHADRFAAFLTYAALESVNGYEWRDWQTALASLPKEGLEESAKALSQALEGAADQREEYWKNRIRPLWKKAWPKQRDLLSSRLAEHLARLCIAAGSRFPAALNDVEAWLQPIEHVHFVVSSLLRSGHCEQFPGDSLHLLDRIISSQPWLPSELAQCLDLIGQADPALTNGGVYQRLRQTWRKNGS